MCGIVGIWSRSLPRDEIRSQLEVAIESLRHRGPDDSGLWSNGSGLALGHTRLSILDLSQAGHQPMSSKDGRFVIVFNGEIYNFLEIRRQLEASGHSFSGTGDTEVILAAFRKWGPTAVNQFIGMFAFALWDDHTKTLRLFRDRIGVKPLYYGWDGRNLVFGSELKALRAFRHWSPDIDRRSLGEYFQFGYIGDDRTIYSGVHKLRPGHQLTLTRDGSPRIERYWSIKDCLGSPLEGTDADKESALENLLTDSFKYRMVSDVPVGVFLSGGVDSSLLVALLAKSLPQAIHTFTIGFAEDAYDESKWAQRVANHCGTEHTEFVLSTQDARPILEDWGNLFDEPFGDDSGIPTLMVSRLASSTVKVVLSADGGDELFSGYQSYTSVLQRLQQLDRVPGWVRRRTSAALELLSPDSVHALISHLPVSTARRVELTRKAFRLKATLDQPSPGRLMDLVLSQWQPDEISSLIGEYANIRKSANDYPGEPEDMIRLWDFHYYLPEDILTKVDRTTMAASIEGREPLLDHRLAEMAFRLPMHMRRGVLGPKHVLKKILYRHVPRELVDRPKQGFANPLENWLRHDLKPLVTDYLSVDRVRAAKVMNSDTVRRLLTDFFDGSSELTRPLWLALAFEMWRERWG